jgi:hypothetical protein
VQWRVRVSVAIALAATMIISCGLLCLLVTESQAADAYTPTIQVIDSGGDTGFHTSVAVDSQDQVQVSYLDYTTAIGRLRYATNPGGLWSTQTIDSNGNVGLYSSIAIDSNDGIHVSYRDETYRSLKYAVSSGGPWDVHTTDSSADMGLWTSTALDSNDQVHISYFDNTNGDLRYATNAGGSWNAYTIDSVGIVGRYSDIAVDSQGHVHICYSDSTNEDLKYATNAGGTWSAQTVDSDGFVGRWTSIAIDSNDKVHISYLDDTNSDLRYATNAAGAWSLGTIDSIGMVGGLTSLALDALDRVHISYYDYTNGDLKYATNAGGVWDTYTIDSAGDVGQDTSIAVDSQGRVHIAYLDVTNLDLKYATFSSVSRPSPPTGLTATPGDGQVQLSWTAPTNDGGGPIDYYVVYQDNVDVKHQAGTTATVTGLTNGVAYKFTIASHNTAGTGTPSADVSATPSSAISLPGVPTNLTATPGDNQVQLSWSAPLNGGSSAVTGYRLYWSLDLSGAFTAMSVAGTSYLHAGLEAGRTYYYRVAAVNQAGEGPSTETVLATTVSSSSLPSAPENLKATVTNGIIELAWDAPTSDGGSAVTGYVVYRGTSSNGMGQVATVNGTAYLDSGLEKGVKYYYNVAAVNGNGMGPATGLADATVGDSSTTTDVLNGPFEYLLAAGFVVAGVAAVVAIFVIKKWRNAP